MKPIWKGSTSLILSVCMVITMLVVMTFAETQGFETPITTITGDNGTIEDKGAQNRGVDNAVAESVYAPQIIVPTKDTMQPAAVGGNFTITLTNGGGDPAYDTDYKYEDNILTILAETALTIQNTDPTTPTTDTIKVASGVEANITLDGVNIDVNTDKVCALDASLAGASTITLAADSANILKSRNDRPGLYVPKDHKLTITGGGKLNATGAKHWPGIGRNGNGNIEIQDGLVTAKGGENGAGIGGSNGFSGGAITISGGTVNATGAYIGAGIGGGLKGAGGNITISGGIVNASGGNGGAGIGGGNNGAGGAITISGGMITATGGYNTADIGHGWEGLDGTVTINGGSIKARNNMFSPQPQNSNGKTVYLNTLTLEGNPANTAISAGSINGVACANTPNGASGVFGIKDVETDVDGKIYFFLTESTKDEVVSLTADGKDYGNSYTRAAGNTNAQTLPLSIGAFLITGGTADNDYKYKDKILTILKDTALTIENADPTTPTTDTIKVASGVEANITLNDINIVVSGKDQPCALDASLAGASTITLAVDSENILKSGHDRPGLYVPGGYKLTITGTGKLYASGGLHWPGIGRNGNGNIEIQDGLVTAKGGQFGAGIGGSHGFAGGDITISGGTVNATCGSESAGIGGGRNGAGGAITISGGMITATGGYNTADIGPGNGGLDGSVTINRGSIKATKNRVNPQPQNSAGQNVYLNTLTLEGNPANTAISAGSINGVACSNTPNGASGVFGIKDVETDAYGKVYFFLTESTKDEAVSLTAGGKDYGNSYTRAANNNNVEMLNLPQANISIEYYFDEIHNSSYNKTINPPATAIVNQEDVFLAPTPAGYMLDTPPTTPELPASALSLDGKTVRVDYITDHSQLARITSANSYSCTADVGGSFQVLATGNPDMFTYTLLGAPSGVSIDGNTGLITMADTLVADTYHFTIYVDNGVKPPASQAFTLIVNAPAPVSHTVLFYNEGSLYATKTVNHGLTLGDDWPGNLSKGGYTFGGWFTEAGTQYTSASIITTNLELYAKWSKNSSSSSSDNSDLDTNKMTSIILIDKEPHKPTLPKIDLPGKVKDDIISAIITEQMVKDAIKAAQDAAQKSGKEIDGIAVEFSITGSANYANLNAIIEAGVISQLKTTGFQYIKIGSAILDLTLDTIAIAEIDKYSNGTITVSAKKQTQLSAAANRLIGSRPVFDITVSYQKNQQSEYISNFGKGTLTLGITYQARDNEDKANLFGVYVDGKGRPQILTNSSYDQTGRLIFSRNSLSTYGVGYKTPAPVFTDTSKHWAKDNIDFVISHDLISGTSATTFAPNTAITRADFLMALGRLSGAELSNFQKSSFSDVATTDTAMPYIEWAFNKKIVSGYGKGEFGPKDPITREQMAVMMVGYAKVTGYRLPVSKQAITFADDSQISAYAKDAVKAIQQTGVISGRENNNFVPQGKATRAEASTILCRFVEFVIDEGTARGWVQNDIRQ